MTGKRSRWNQHDKVQRARAVVNQALGDAARLDRTFLAVPDNRDAMSEPEQDSVLDGMIDHLVVEQGLEISDSKTILASEMVRACPNSCRDSQEPASQRRQQPITTAGSR
jgi:hypothetical protein